MLKIKKLFIWYQIFSSSNLISMKNFSSGDERTRRLAVFNFTDVVVFTRAFFHYHHSHESMKSFSFEVFTFFLIFTIAFLFHFFVFDACIWPDFLKIIISISSSSSEVFMSLWEAVCRSRFISAYHSSSQNQRMKVDKNTSKRKAYQDKSFIRFFLIST